MKPISCCESRMVWRAAPKTRSRASSLWLAKSVVMPAPSRPTARIGKPPAAGAAAPGGASGRGTGAGRHALAAGKARELHRRLLVEVGADELPQPIGEARRAGRRRAAHQHRQVVHRIVDEIVFGPEIVAADQRLAAVDGDELGVRPGEALAGLEGGAGAHGGHVDGEPRARNVAQLRCERRQQRRCVDAVGRILADDEADRDRPAARRQLVEARRAARRESACPAWAAARRCRQSAGHPRPGRARAAPGRRSGRSRPCAGPAPAVAAQIVPQVPPPGQSASLLQDGSMTSRSQFLQSSG